MHIASVLREWQDDDGAWYVDQLSDPQIQQFTTETPTTTAARFREALTTMRLDPTQAGMAVVSPSGGLAGNMTASSNGPEVRFSYWVAADARGQGLASKALAEMCSVAADLWPEARTARLWVHTDNRASQRAAEVAGFRYEATRDGTLQVRGQQWPVRWYTRPLRP